MEINGPHKDLCVDIIMLPLLEYIFTENINFVPFTLYIVTIITIFKLLLLQH